MSTAPVLVVGATGNVGRHGVKHLLGSGCEVRALARDPGVLKGAISLAHGESERRLHASGIAAVLVKPVTLTSNLMGNAEAIRSGSLPSVFGDGRVSFVDPRDVAELIARALIDPQHDGEALKFGGPAALTYDEVAGTLSEVLGRLIAHVRIDVPASRESAAGRGLPTT